ncbi:ABC transporter permease [Leucobacter sp. CSA1]|uniref:ABC transporter permease n=1 Tax=Leucobacter chromiisoli TaxID=2796471 RepID=A0A934QAY4_9MICO|nr:ABC transporter permease [Leucobacter chromiisoli]MBK0420406.1 ABC transporter permease [Leucobacter chromiisoli]
MAVSLMKRVGGALVTLLVTSFVVYGALYLVPGDPVATLLRGRKVTPEAVAAVRDQYRLDDPFLVRYWDWLTGFVTGDFGQSLQFRQDVAGLIASRLPTTALLIGLSALLIVIVGLMLGLLSALKPGWVDRSLVATTSIASSVPVFIGALLLIYIFSAQLSWFPAFGSGGGSLLERIHHLTLPALALALSYAGIVARVSRSSFRREATSTRLDAARARGITGPYLLRHHVVRNGLVPVLTLSGSLIAGLLVTSQIVEVAFGLNGLGSLLVESVRSIDFSVVQAIAMIIVAAFILTNMVIDLLLPLIDPRMRR